MIHRTDTDLKTPVVEESDWMPGVHSPRVGSAGPAIVHFVAGLESSPSAR